MIKTSEAHVRMDVAKVDQCIPIVEISKEFLRDHLSDRTPKTRCPSTVPAKAMEAIFDWVLLLVYASP